MSEQPKDEIVYNIDINGKYIIQVPWKISASERAHNLEMIEAWLKDPERHFLMISDNVKLVKVE